MGFSAIAGGIASGVAGAGINKLFGGGGGDEGIDPRNMTPIGLKSAGLNAEFSDYGAGKRFMHVNRGQSMKDALGRLRSLTDEQSGELTDLLGLVRPGMSQLRNAQLARIENARNRSIGNLSDNLARRRVLGSSFAQDALGRADREFAQAEAEVEATSFLQELDLTNKLLEQRFQTNLESVMTEINQTNFESDLAARLTGAASSAMVANNQINASLSAARAKLAAEGAAGMGKFFEPFTSAIGQGVSSLFGGGGDGGFSIPSGASFAVNNSVTPNLGGGSFF